MSRHLIEGRRNAARATDRLMDEVEDDAAAAGGRNLDIRGPLSRPEDGGTMRPSLRCDIAKLPARGASAVVRET